MAIPAGLLTFLVAIAPPIGNGRPDAGAPLITAADGQPFRYIPNDQTYALDFDPRAVQLDLFEGWDREQQAYDDRSALAYISGPMYERHVDRRGQEITVPLGDIKLGDRVWRGLNRTAARQRAFIGIRHDGSVEFGYGELTPARAREFESFIGGLHSLYNDLGRPPSAYKGAYSISMGQQIRYFLPRIRMVIGLRPDGRVEVLMSRDGLTLEQTRELARSRGLRAAYLPDHASKSRFIIPGVKGFSDADANWISGGATSFVHVPYMLRLSRRHQILQGSLLAGMASRSGPSGCGNPFQCGQTLGGQLVDRALAGFNRLMEKGVDPIARLIWAPKGKGGSNSDRAPFRETPISADPLALRQQQQEATQGADYQKPNKELNLPADLPPPLLLPDGYGLTEPAEPAAATAPEESGDPNGEGASQPPTAPPPPTVGSVKPGAPAAPPLPPP
ncbi:hypothetical protein [Cyanobium sp. WAJ14-Wanaka]|uniref:hypothetical protein n=1 Tax=Cyanobium sp. WAJ14-Wanaka TaxID=2823725 RepID=UPI0037BE9F6A